MIALLAALTFQQDTALLATAARESRAYAAAHAPAAPRGATAAQYRVALAALDSAKWDDAALRLRAVALLDPRNPAVKSDLGYANARLGRWDDAADAWQAASGMQPGNPWFYVGLGIARAGQERYVEAAGNLALAANTDSSVISPAFITAITGYYDHAARAGDEVAWYRVATARYPDQPRWWLEFAQALRAANDTTNGLAAARRYVAMRPGEPQGLAALAGFLGDAGQSDSATAIAARLAAADTAYRPFAMRIFWTAGARAFRAQDYALAGTILKQGMQYARLDMLPRFALYAGHAELEQAVALVRASNANRDCNAALTSDSLAFQADTNLRQAVSLDSVTVTTVLTTTIPAVHQQAGRLKAALCGQQQQQRRP